MAGEAEARDVAGGARRGVRGRGLVVGALTGYGPPLDGGPPCPSGSEDCTAPKALTNAQIVSGPPPKATTRQNQGGTPIPMPAKATRVKVPDENMIRAARLRRRRIVTSISALPR